MFKYPDWIKSCTEGLVKSFAIDIQEALNAAYQDGYADGKKSQIKVNFCIGDEVVTVDGYGIVTAVNEKGVVVLYKNGETSCVKYRDVSKTNKTYPQINNSLIELKDLGGENENGNNNIS